MLVQHRLAHSGHPDNFIHAGAVIALGYEGLLSCSQQLCASFIPRHFSPERARKPEHHSHLIERPLHDQPLPAFFPESACESRQRSLPAGKGNSSPSNFRGGNRLLANEGFQERLESRKVALAVRPALGRIARAPVQATSENESAHVVRGGWDSVQGLT